MYAIISPFLLLVILSILAKIFSEELQLVNIGMIHLLPILYAAMRLGRKATLLVSLASIVSFNFFFIPPTLTFAVHDGRYVVSFVIMLIIGQLVAWLSEQAALAKELETSERLQKTLLGSLSHELRTPLAAIMGASSGLLTEELELSLEQQKEFYHTIDHGAHRMGRLIDNLLDTARLQSGVLRLKIQECDIRELLGSALAKSENAFPARLRIEPNLSTIQGDGVLIEQAIFNLLENAFKYGDTVIVTIESEPMGIQIRICNTGSVPPSNEAVMAWKPFSRLSNVRGEEGIGLGLYVAYRIAQLHGGSVETHSDGEQFCATMRLLHRGEG